MTDSAASKDPIVIEHTFDAPVDLIWQMWTVPEHFKAWYGPRGFTVPVAEMDVRVGGKHLFCMERQTPDGTMQFCSTGEYTEVVPDERLIYTDSMADGDGNANPATTVVTVQLEDLGGRTRMVLTHAGLPADEPGASEGWKQAFAKLAEYLETILSD